MAPTVISPAFEVLERLTVALKLLILLLLIEIRCPVNIGAEPQIHCYLSTHKLNYDDSHNTWEPWKNLRLCEALHVYLRNNNMSRFIPKDLEGSTDEV